MTENTLQPNEGKKLEKVVAGVNYLRFPIKTHVVKPTDDIEAVVKQYLAHLLQTGDMVAISEKVVAITQGRSYPIKDIKPSWLAKLLVKFVFKPKWGIGLGSPWTMELALREAGAPRILFAALASAITKPFGVRGVFYRVAGKNINAIDGPTPYTLPPYNEYAKLAPKDPENVAQKLAELLKVGVAIIDANDIGVQVLGASEGMNIELIRELFKDNPLGQTTEQTPLCIIRKC
ncbi:MAG: coenzyme F420-0:L-glutamate ligase [bacterium]|nr:coenzyme F420-0:L-glutamate ligase [bacterium]